MLYYFRRFDCAFPMSTSNQTPVVSRTPLPLPTHFSHAQHSFTVKKWKPPFSFLSYSSQSPFPPLYHCLPPRPPSKGSTPLSRVFPHRTIQWTPLSRSLIESPPPLSVYDPSQPQSFFSQCFTNLGLIGRGSFGEVFKVVSLIDNCQYAVKRSVHRFRSEVERAKSITEAWNHEELHPHPYILGFIAAWEEAGHLYIQTELCCTSLLLYAEETPCHTGEMRAWTYLCDMLSALTQLHACGFAHLDIKPANFFITKSGRLKLGDFGLLIKLPANVQKQVTGEKREMKRERDDLQEGDPRYMAPELLRGDYGTAADIFSLGISILELACNIEVPKGGDDWQLLRNGHLPKEFTNVLSEDMLYILRLMLTPEPCNRATAQQLLSLPFVRKQKWKRHLYLCIFESFLSLFQWSQSLFYGSWNFISSLSLLFKTSVCESTSTPPRERWERDADISNIHSFSESPIHHCVFPSDVSEHSPTHTHRVQAMLSSGSTSTLLPESGIDVIHASSHNQCIPSPSRIHYSSNSLIHHRLTGSVCIDERNRITTELSDKRNFEPKNLLSLFEETTLDGDR